MAAPAGAKDPAQLHFLRLPAERQAEVVRRLHAVRGYDVAAIASMTGLGVESVRSLLSEAQP